MTTTIGDLLVDLIQHRDDALAAVDPIDGQQLALDVVQEAMFIMHKLLGKDLLAMAIGTIDETDRRLVLETAARRLHALSGIFGKMPVDAAGPFSIVQEAISVSRGDAPLMFARLPGQKVNNRIIRAKFEALQWEAYLKGRGMRAGECQQRIAMAFGSGWETIRRSWRRDVHASLDEAQIKYLIGVAELEGRRGVPRWEMPDDDWEEALRRDGERCKKAVSENNGNR